MDTSLTNTAIWEEIERSESYLVCCMFEKATSLASSVLQRLCTSNSSDSIEDVQLADMMESAGMVLVQSLRELGRTPQILDELKCVFGVVTAIPVEVLLAGACFQISEGPQSGLTEFLEEFLCKWSLVDGQFYALPTAESNGAYLKGADGRCILEIEKYLEVVEVYAVSLLGMVLKDSDHAIDWVEKADLPEENRQELLRRIHSLCSLKAANSSQEAEKSLKDDKYEAHSDARKDSTLSKTQGTSLSSKGLRQPNGGTNTKQNIYKLTEQLEPCFWWYRTVTLKFGNARLVISNGKMVLWSLLILFASYVLRKKHASLKRIVGEQVLAVKKALVDMWDLAFSVQVNPLAAVQPLTGPGPGPGPTQGSR